MKYLLVAAALALSVNAWAVDDRNSTEPTQFWWYSGVNQSQVESNLAANDARLISVQSEWSDPNLFTVVMVRNEGGYRVDGTRFVTGINANTFQDYVQQQGMAPLDLYATFNNDGSTSYASILAPAAAAPTAWYIFASLTADDMTSQVSQVNGRVISLQSSVVNGTPVGTALVLDNSSDQRQVWFFQNVTADYINQQVQATKAHITRIDPDGSGTFSVVMERTPGVHWWWYYGKTEAQIHQLTDQNRARLVDLKSYYSSSGTKVFAAAMIQNY
jgi:hypothetical protein